MEGAAEGSETGGAIGPPEFRLYVAGNAPNSLLALENFTAIANEYMGDYRIEVVDLMDDPLRAINDGVLVTPTLVRLSPPAVRVIGNLRDAATVIVALGLNKPNT